MNTHFQQHFGDVTVDVERRNVQHFAVQTPYLAAVVKGTRFSVAVQNGGASVNVDRGAVQVRDTARELVVEVRQGQSASAGTEAQLNVSGEGELPAVETASGILINASAASTINNANQSANNANRNARGNSGNSNAGGNSSNANSNAGRGNNNEGGNGNGNRDK